MKIFRLFPVILSFLLLAAHYYRAGSPVLTGACIGILVLLFFRKPWVPRLFQVLLVLGSLEWLRSLYYFAAMRIAWDQPWARLALILGGVALFTLLSALVFEYQKLKKLYRRDGL